VVGHGSQWPHQTHSREAFCRINDTKTTCSVAQWNRMDYPNPNVRTFILPLRKPGETPWVTSELRPLEYCVVHAGTSKVSRLQLAGPLRTCTAAARSTIL
jgi:hypothetical protein